MHEVQFVDTTLRDGQLSLWALGMKTGAMLVAGKTAVEEMIAAGAPRQYAGCNQPLVRLIDELSRNNRVAHVYIRKGDFSLALKRGG